jgi:putative hydrolase of the HAD superfamily
MALFFDLDATLLDHSASQLGGLNALGEFSSELRAHLHDGFLRTWQQSESRHFLRYEQGELTIEEHRRVRLRECFPDYCGNCDDAALDKLYELYLEGYRSAWVLYPDAHDILNQLPGPKALITNGDSKLQRAKIERLGLADSFERVYISGEVGIAKPDSRIFSKACEDLKLPPHEVSYVGDNFRNDIEGSAGAGLRPVWINRERAPKPQTSISFHEIYSLKELLSAFSNG